MYTDGTTYAVKTRLKVNNFPYKEINGKKEDTYPVQMIAGTFCFILMCAMHV